MTPQMVAGNHPETDDFRVLGDSDHQKYQMLLCMMNWIVTIGRLDIAYAMSSLAHFAACPRQGHIDRTIYVF
eukprot:13503136-Ditylum_brightwellii.AAC.1